jgi:hypothetical protein
MKLKAERKRALVDFLVNLASAWAIGGIITPWFLKPAITALFFFDIMIMVGNIAACFYLVWRITRK